VAYNAAEHQATLSGAPYVFVNTNPSGSPLTYLNNNVAIAYRQEETAPIVFQSGGNVWVRVVELDATDHLITDQVQERGFRAHGYQATNSLGGKLWLDGEGADSTTDTGHEKIILSDTQGVDLWIDAGNNMTVSEDRAARGEIHYVLSNGNRAAYTIPAKAWITDDGQRFVRASSGQSQDAKGSWTAMACA
jgi:hypothetical protein